MGNAERNHATNSTQPMLEKSAILRNYSKWQKMPPHHNCAGNRAMDLWQTKKSINISVADTMNYKCSGSGRHK